MRSIRLTGAIWPIGRRIRSGSWTCSSVGSEPRSSRVGTERFNGPPGPPLTGAIVRITKVYTRTGDKGTTKLVGGEERPKDTPRIEAYGTVDELGSVLGVVRAFLD